MKIKLGDEVFRQRIIGDNKPHGLVGFAWHDGIDCLRITSWANGQQQSVEFEISAMPALARLIQHAYETKARPDEDGCYSFPKLDWNAPERGNGDTNDAESDRS